jgi:hypothetical protein
MKYVNNLKNQGAYAISQTPKLVASILGIASPSPGCR